MPVCPLSPKAYNMLFHIVLLLILVSELSEVNVTFHGEPPADLPELLHDRDI